MSTLEMAAARIAYRGLLIAAETIAVDRPAETALYLLVTGGNVPGSLAASVHGCTKQYVSRVLREIEDRRDDARFDAQLRVLETRIFEEV